MNTDSGTVLALVAVMQHEIERLYEYVRNSSIVPVQPIDEWLAHELLEDINGVQEKYMRMDTFARSFAAPLRDMSDDEEMKAMKHRLYFMLKVSQEYFRLIAESEQYMDSVKHEKMLEDYVKYVEKTRRNFTF